MCRIDGTVNGKYALNRRYSSIEVLEIKIQRSVYLYEPLYEYIHISFVVLQKCGHLHNIEV
jgi:hypothetical protein